MSFSDTEVCLQIKKTRFWSAILYPENMVDNWQDNFDAIIQVPFAYCVHDQDLQNDADETRKIHIHVLYCFPGPTTYSHALAVINQFSKPSARACSTIQPIVYFKRAYDYLIHNTDDSRKKGKYQYDAALRISGNDFDFGRLEQLSVIEKKDISKEISNLIVLKQFLTITDLYIFITQNFDDTYYYVLEEKSPWFERLIKGNWQKSEIRKLYDKSKI